MAGTHPVTRQGRNILNRYGVTIYRAFCNKTGNMYPPLDFYMGRKSLSPILPPVGDHPRTKLQSGRLARSADAGAADSCVIPELGKRVVSKSSKVSPSDCKRLSERTTKHSSLILGFLERALCNLPEPNKSLLQVLHAFLEAFLSTFLYFP
jgi:hypothetical protein